MQKEPSPDPTEPGGEREAQGTSEAYFTPACPHGPPPPGLWNSGVTQMARVGTRGSKHGEPQGSGPRPGSPTPQPPFWCLPSPIPSPIRRRTQACRSAGRRTHGGHQEAVPRVPWSPGVPQEAAAPEENLPTAATAV